ncbi:MAG: ABC transporter ATP-binding protein [Pseudomonadota bacterium]
MADLLVVQDLCAGYGAAVVLEQLSFTLEQGGSLALLGRNGMGKTTLLSALMGAARLHGGGIRFDGRDITALAPQRRAAAGLGWVPQEREIFPSLTVQENLTVAARPGAWDLKRIYATFPRLRERSANMGNQLSGGEQQMLAMARALMLNPRLLLLDEPLEGLAPIIVEELLRVIQALLADGGMSVILVEQHAHQILPLTRQALVLERGRAVYNGDSATLLREPQLLEQWLGMATA